MKHYDYIYSICCFSGFHGGEIAHHNRLEGNIFRHLLFVQHYKYARTKKICVILCQRGEDKTTHEMLYRLAKDVTAPNIDVHVITNPNWGMTVGTMWDAFQWCKENKISSDYWWTLDDDYICNHWKEREDLLQNGFNMVGQWEVMSWGDNNREHYIKCWELGYKIPTGHADDGVLQCLNRLDALPEHRCWTDGGHYIMKFSDLLELEKKAGCFMKVPNNKDGTKDIITPDNDGYGRHGIMYGEVGFPTLMKARGMKFCAFSERSYLTDRWDRVDVSQTLTGHLTIEWNNPSKNQFYRDENDHRWHRCMAKVPPFTDIRDFLLSHIELQPKEFPYRDRPVLVRKVNPRRPKRR
jgi:hypothetical protein